MLKFMYLFLSYNNDSSLLQRYIYAICYRCTLLNKHILSLTSILQARLHIDKIPVFLHLYKLI